MAEETDGQEVVEPEVAPVEEAETEEQQEQPADPVESLARELGWRPKEEFRGDETQWKPAADFIRDGRDVQRTMSRELRSVRDEVSRISRTSSQLLADKLAEQENYWRNVHRKAVEDGDHSMAERAVQERDKIKAAAPEPVNDLPPETTDFMERNKAWFGKDPLATLRAKQVAKGLADDGLSIPEQLRQAERAIRKEFPELFPAQAKQPAAVQTAQARSSPTGSRKKGFADMPAESQRMAQSYLKEHGIPLEKFAESYWQDQERKVG